MNVLKAVTAPVRGAVSVVIALPRVVETILVLPKVADQLDQVCANTQVLPAMLQEIEGIRRDTHSLPIVEAELRGMRVALDKIEQNTLAVELLAETVVPLQGAALRVGRFADRLPQRRFASGNGNGNGNGNGRLAPQRDARDHQRDAQ
jgi:hypothetical protein